MTNDYYFYSFLYKKKAKTDQKRVANNTLAVKGYTSKYAISILQFRVPRRICAQPTAKNAGQK